MLRLTIPEYEELQPWELMARVKGYNDDKINEMHRTRLIMASFTGKDPRHLIPLPGDFENMPIMGEMNTKKMLKRAGLNDWMN